MKIFEARSWSFVIKDWRRVEPGHSLLGRGKDAYRVTGVECRPTALPGVACAAELRTFPVLAPSAEELMHGDDEMPEGDIDARKVEEEVLLHRTQEVLGWKTRLSTSSERKRIEESQPLTFQTQAPARNLIKICKKKFQKPSDTKFRSSTRSRLPSGSAISA